MWKMSDGKPVIKFCRETGASYSTIWKNINDKGMDIDEACKKGVERKGRKDNSLKYFVNDTPLIQYCRDIGINYNSVYNKMYRGLSQEKALELVKNKTKEMVS